MKNLARIHHGFQPGTGLRRALHRNQQRQEALLVFRAGIFAQSLAERQMLRFGFGREPSGIRGEKCERRIWILAVLGNIEMDAADQVPGRIPAFQKILHACFGFG